MNKEIKEMQDIEIIPVEKKIISIDTTDIDIVKKRINDIQGVSVAIKKSLVENSDWQNINFGGKLTPTLLKGGADKICLIYGFVKKYEIVESVLTKEFISYIFKCTITKFDTGEFIAEGYGSLNSEEQNHKSGLSKANTILKIAKKRAMVDAVISIGNLSAIFTQDIEEHVKNNNRLTEENKIKLFKLTAQKVKFTNKPGVESLCSKSSYLSYISAILKNAGINAKSYGDKNIQDSDYELIVNEIDKLVIVACSEFDPIEPIEPIEQQEPQSLQDMINLTRDGE